MDRRTLTHDEVAADLPAYVLGALDADESDAVALHVDACPRCQAERDRLERTVGALGTLVPGAAPPPDLRARFLDQLNDTPAASASMPTLAAPTPIRASSRVPRWAGIAAAVAAAIILALGALSAALYRDLSQTRDDLAATQQQVSAEREILAGPARTISMVATGTNDAYGTLYLASEDNRAVMVVDDLAPTPVGRVYQIWLVQGDQRASAGVFTVDASGSARVLIQPSNPLASYQSLGITEEPGPNGSPGPTGPRVIGCSLAERS